MNIIFDEKMKLSNSRVLMNLGIKIKLAGDYSSKVYTWKKV